MVHRWRAVRTGTRGGSGVEGPSTLTRSPAASNLTRPASPSDSSPRSSEPQRPRGLKARRSPRYDRPSARSRRQASAPAPRSDGRTSGEGPNDRREKAWVPLTGPERRVLGVLVEKAKTTPEYYPLTLAAIVTGCNQKSNRDPVTNFDADDVEEILNDLRKKGAVVLVEGGGRVVRWKHTLYDWLKVSKVELAVDGRTAPPGVADRGRPPRPGQPDGAPGRPRRAPGRPRVAARQGPGRLPHPARGPPRGRRHPQPVPARRARAREGPTSAAIAGRQAGTGPRPNGPHRPSPAARRPVGRGRRPPPELDALRPSSRPWRPTSATSRTRSAPDVAPRACPDRPPSTPGKGLDRDGLARRPRPNALPRRRRARPASGSSR